MASNAGRGRSTLEANSAAVARIASLHSHRALILAARDRVTGSAAFHSSKRARDLFSYIVDAAVSGTIDDLKERMLGAAVFGRDPAYDTGSDAIVRVAASDVRKRLQLYYQQASDDPVVFELPTGSYVPAIHVRAEVRAEALPLETIFPDHAPASVPELLPSFAVPNRRVSWKLLAIAGWLFSLLLIVAVFWVRRPATVTPAQEPLGLPWSAIFRGPQTLQVIVADSSMGALRNVKPFPASLEDFANQRFLVPNPELEPALRRVWSALARGRLTSLADARISARVAALAALRGKSFAIHSARDIQLADMQSASGVFLLGSAASNPWVLLYENQMSFRIPWTPRGQTASIRDPRPGDPKNLDTSVGSGTTGQGYALLALTPALQGDGAVLIAAGTTMEGTEMAGDLAFDSKKLGAILSTCGVSLADAKAHFEVLMGLKVTAGSRRESNVLATRCTP